jgi:hypothetical protein
MNKNGEIHQIDIGRSDESTEARYLIEEPVVCSDYVYDFARRDDRGSSKWLSNVHCGLE